jgi:hypothetical protein
MKRTSAERTTRRMPFSIAKSNADATATMPNGTYSDPPSVDALSDGAMNGSSGVDVEERFDMFAGADQRHASNSEDDTLRARIAERAYELYQSRNGSDGDPVSDWLQAEAEIRSRNTESNGRS